ncbi:MAG TPA: caspase family protein [Kofleriaceae bacterium]|jgi:hypothetical protein|nr:caspase family protein [Kofleriaceae bacterium]
MTHRDIIAAEVPTLARARPGRKRIAAIGIDRYRSWPVLGNAVRDAEGASRLFEQLGFEPVGKPLLDDAATGAAIQAFVTDDLMALGPDDSLVLFFAGHGGTRTQWLGGEQIKTGYLIPADAALGEKVATWIELDDWLRKIARLPPRHILVILDACFAGIALTPVVKWRDSGTFQEASLGSLQARRSRRIITSALDDQVALDSGPIPGHSLFTGCLIEGFKHGQLGHGRGAATGTEVGLYLQQRVGSYPNSHQTPDFGTFEHDDRGEMLIPLLTEPFDPEITAVRPAQVASLEVTLGRDGVDDEGEGDIGTRSRTRWIAPAAAFATIVLVSSLVLISSLATEPSLAAESPVRGRAPDNIWVPLASDAAVAAAAAVTPLDGNTRATSTRDAPPPPSAGSASAPPARGQPPRASQVTAHVTKAPPPGAEPKPAADARPKTPGDVVPTMLASTAIAPAAEEITIAKPRVRAPPNRRLKPAVDERNCPVKGSQEVRIESYPPGATLYLNHKECGELGKTPWSGKLPPSKGTATGTFTAILERTGADPVTQEFEILRSTRIQRVEIRMPPKR